MSGPASEDITARMNAEARLRDSKAMLASIFGTLRTGVFLIDKDGYYAEVNDAFCQICGYSQDELIGKHFTIILSDDEQKQFGMDVLQHFFTGYMNGPSEWTIKHKKGEKVIVKIAAKVMEREDCSRYVVTSIEDITQQKQVERALRRSEENFRKIVETAAEGIWKTDKDEKITFVNRRFAEMVGYDPNQMIGQSIWDFLSRQASRGGYSRHKHQHKQDEVRKDYQFKCKSGSYRWGLISTTMLYDDAGNEEGTLWMLSDITDRKHAEEMLLRKNKLLRGVTNSSRHLLTNTNFDSGIGKALKVLGLTSRVDCIFVFQTQHDSNAGHFLMTEQFKWLHHSDRDKSRMGVSYAAEFTIWKNRFTEARHIVTTPDQLPLPERKYLEAYGVKSLLIVPVVISKESWGFIWFAKSAENHEWTEIEQSILVAAAGNIGAAIARKNAVQALYESEKKYRSVVDSVSEVIFQTDLAGNWTFLNPAWEEIMQFSVEESLGKKVVEFVLRDDRDKIGQSMMQMCLGDKSHCRNEIRFMTKKGEERWMEILAQKINDPHGSMIGISGMLYDVTEHKRAIERQAILVKGLNDANRELKEFAYVVSHDLKAPLRAIGSLSSWLYTDYADKIDETGREQLEMLVGRVKRMHDLIEGILQYSRIGRVKEDVVMVDLGEVIGQAIEMVSPPGHIRVEVKGGLPKVKGDRTRMQQVFQNLLSNAVKYMDKEEGMIEIGSREAPEEWEIYVKDNGPGIEEKYHEKIFQIFQTLSPRDERESTGIGLTIVKKIVEGYGGEVKVVSEVGKGSEFRVKLPKIINGKQSNFNNAWNEVVTVKN
ncbi:MAG: PAS domain S-box protein [Geobacteraceae bacterium]|nr:PAS domain S-box protein [Geobacteraceae bacterium]